jgi:competence protein ComGF
MIHVAVDKDRFWSGPYTRKLIQLFLLLSFLSLLMKCSVVPNLESKYSTTANQTNTMIYFDSLSLLSVQNIRLDECHHQRLVCDDTKHDSTFRSFQYHKFCFLNNRKIYGLSTLCVRRQYDTAPHCFAFIV